MRYGEIPKSCTMENRQNIEHQLYATIQRKQAPIPPFNGATNVSKGFDTIDRLKIVRYFIKIKVKFSLIVEWYLGLSNIRVPWA